MMYKNKKILVVEDELKIRNVISMYLKKEGFSVIETGNGLEALSLTEKEKPDLVILDIIMPAMGGDVVLKKLMEIDKKAKVLMVTAVGQEQIMKQCRKVGALGYLVKPFKEKQVLKIIKKIIGPGKGQKIL